MNEPSGARRRRCALDSLSRLAAGSELNFAVDAAKKVEAEGKKVRDTRR